MKDIHLRPHQIKAVEAIQQALKNHQKHMVVEMPVGCGKGIVLVKTVEILRKQGVDKLLVITGSLNVKEQISHSLYRDYEGPFQIDKYNTIVKTEQWLYRHLGEIKNEFQFIVFFDAGTQKIVQELLNNNEKTIIVFATNNIEHPRRLFTTKEVVFSYSYKEAVNDGILTPAMDSKALGPAVESFGKQLLKQFGYAQDNSNGGQPDSNWDLVMYNPNQRIWVECKVYKSQVVSPSAANSLLNTMVMRRMKRIAPEDGIILLVVFSRIPSFQKDVIFDRYRIVVWDIENLVFYCKNDPALLRQLSQITYFPIDHIEGQVSAEAEKAQLVYIPAEDKILLEAEKEEGETDNLLQRLSDCKTGQKNSGEYEKICEAILRSLFEANYFNRLTSQHKTNDEHFRMDLIGSLKINQSNEESMHPLWQMLVQHYNSHFVVFEFKNYKDEIDQNLIYITEKYLFDAALRNVAIIISRKGFSKAAKFAAEGCLKEHGKLILSVTDEDLVKMLELKSDKAADYLLDKLEDFLMGISK